MAGASSACKSSKVSQVMGDALPRVRGHRDGSSEGRVWVLEMLPREGEAAPESWRVRGSIVTYSRELVKGLCGGTGREGQGWTEVRGQIMEDLERQGKGPGFQKKGATDSIAW